MATDYGFFQASVEEVRTYNVQSRFYEEAVREPAHRPHLLLRRKGETLRVRGRHVMRPGNRIGVARVNERFDVTLPDEVDDFYRRWDGGLLLFAQQYTLFSAEEMIRQTMWVRELQKQYNPAGLPWHVVRFAEVENGDYLGLRLKRDGKWDVVFMPVERTDADFLPPKDTETQNLVLDVGFRDWLLRMCNSDGWPVSCTSSTLMFGDRSKSGPPGQRVMPRSRRG